MAKKSFGKMMVFAAITGAAIGAGLYYLKKYKSFNEELEEEFLDIEGDDEDDSSFSETEETKTEEAPEDEISTGGMEKVETAELESSEETKEMPEDEAEPEEENAGESEESSDAKRKYIPLNVNTDKLKAAARDTGEKAIDALKDGASILSGFVHDAAPVVKDKMHTFKTKASEKIESYKHAKDNEDSEDGLLDEDEEISVSLDETESTEETTSDTSALSPQETEEKEKTDAEENPKEPEESLEKTEETKETAETESTIDVEEQKE